MHVRTSMAAVLACTLSAAFAQPEAASGQWVGTMEGNGGRPVPVEVTINGNAGTWRMTPVVAGARGNPCFGKDFPMSVESTADAVILDIRGGQVIAGCIEQRATLTMSNGQLTGKLANGRAVSLSKK